MAACEVCGNHYDKTLEIHFDGGVHIFDSFECAIHALAPVAPTAAAGSSAMAWNPTAKFIVAPIALGTAELQPFATEREAA